MTTSASSADLLPYLPAFVAVCEEKSFRKAAERLGLSTAAVSKSVQRLEEELGVQLLERTTRNVTVTRPGLLVQQRFQGALVEINAARALVDNDRSEPQGELVLHVSPVLAPPVLTAAAAVCARHPRVLPRVIHSDRHAKPQEDDVDVAIRLGDIVDDRLVARKLAVLPFVTVAAPGYLARRGTPTSTADVAAHDVVAFAGPRGALHRWHLGERELELTPRIVVDQGSSLVDAALLGLGLVQVFAFMAGPHVRAGRLVRVFADVEHDARTVHALSTTAKAKTRAVRSAVECLQKSFSDLSAP